MVADSTSSKQGSSCAVSVMLKRPAPSVVALAGKPALHLAVTDLAATAAPVAATPVMVMGVMLLPPQLASSAPIVSAGRVNRNIRMVSPGGVLIALHLARERARGRAAKTRTSTSGAATGGKFRAAVPRPGPQRR